MLPKTTSGSRLSKMPLAPPPRPHVLGVGKLPRGPLSAGSSFEAVLGRRVPSAEPTPKTPAKPHSAFEGAEPAPNIDGEHERARAGTIDDGTPIVDEGLAMLDPSGRGALLLAPPVTSTSSIASTGSNASTTHEAARAAEIAALAHLTVDGASFWGNGTKGVARLRFGRDARGGLAGSTVTLEHDGERLSLSVEGLDDETASALRQRLGALG